MIISSARQGLILSKPLRLTSSALSPILVAVAYYAGAEAAFAIGTMTHMFAPFWPPNVVLLCALLSAPERRWWAYALAVFPAHLVAEWGVAMPVPQMLAAFACNLAVALLNAVALRRLLILLRHKRRLMFIGSAGRVAAWTSNEAPGEGDGETSSHGGDRV
jgi:integral membrane sensor domain MASE1